jgi:excisionase family DNA binding protein
MSDRTSWYTTGEVAEMLGVSDRTIVNWARAGELAYFTTPGGHRRFNEAEVRAFIDRRSTGRQRAATV